MHDIFINTCYDNLSRKPFSIGENVSITIQLVKRQSCHHTETSQLICRANQFYIMATLAFNELSHLNISDAERGIMNSYQCEKNY